MILGMHGTLHHAYMEKGIIAVNTLHVHSTSLGPHGGPTSQMLSSNWGFLAGCSSSRWFQILAMIQEPDGHAHFMVLLLVTKP